MRLVTWNIKSLRLRLPLLAEIVEALNPDVICLQELFLGPYFCQQEDARLFDLAPLIGGYLFIAVSGLLFVALNLLFRFQSMVM